MSMQVGGINGTILNGYIYDPEKVFTKQVILPLILSCMNIHFQLSKQNGLTSITISVLEIIFLRNAQSSHLKR